MPGSLRQESMCCSRRRSTVGAMGGIAQIHDIQDLLVDNQRFAATNVALQQQLISAQHKLRAVSLASNKARAEREDDVGNTADQTARIEAEARTVAGARVEVEQVHADVRALAAARTELMDRLRVLRKQLGRTKSESAKADNVGSQGDPEGQKDLLRLKGRIEKKSAYLQELQDQVRI
ncbi:hypothetical protein ACQ4PT_042825 [Festuca glaucescens]